MRCPGERRGDSEISERDIAPRSDHRLYVMFLLESARVKPIFRLEYSDIVHPAGFGSNIESLLRKRYPSTKAQVRALIGKMTTNAEELMRDFEDSGEEDGEENNVGYDDGFTGGFSSHGLRPSDPSDAHYRNGGMDLDDDEEEVGDDDEDDAALDKNMREPEDEEETKARVEKMQLGAVGDVRSIASLMKTLEPVLEVSISPRTIPHIMYQLQIYMVEP